MILYDSPVSGNCYKVRLLAAHLGLPLERRPLDVVDRSNRPEVIGDLNPALRVPTLVLDDGRPLGESGAILWYLARARASCRTTPTRLAQALQWMFFEQYDFEPNIAVARFLIMYARRSRSSTPTGCPRCRRAATRRSPRSSSTSARIATTSSASGLSIADIALYGYTHVADEGGFDLGRYPAIRAWIARVATEPGHIPIDA